jgi:hypothetical protein
MAFIFRVHGTRASSDTRAESAARFRPRAESSAAEAKSDVLPGDFPRVDAQRASAGNLHVARAVVQCGTEPRSAVGAVTSGSWLSAGCGEVGRSWYLVSGNAGLMGWGGNDAGQVIVATLVVANRHRAEVLEPVRAALHDVPTLVRFGFPAPAALRCALTCVESNAAESQSRSPRASASAWSAWRIFAHVPSRLQHTKRS